MSLTGVRPCRRFVSVGRWLLLAGAMIGVATPSLPWRTNFKAFNRGARSVRRRRSRRIGIEIEMQPDRAKPDRRVLGHAQRAAHVEVAFGAHRPIAQLDPQRSGYRLQR